MPIQQLRKLNSDEERNLFLGDYIREYLCIHLDEWSTERWNYGFNYTGIRVYNHSYRTNRLEPVPVVRITLDNVDDSGFSCNFRLNSETNLSTIKEKVYEFCKRSNFRYVNINAFRDYCVWLGAQDVDLY
jgi:hypothetical protein